MIEAVLFRRILRKTLLIPTIGMALMALLLVLEISDLLNAAAWEDHADQAISKARQVRRILEQIPASERSYLLTGDRADLNRWESEQLNFLRTVQDLRKFVGDNHRQVQNIDLVLKDYDRFIAANRAEIDAYEHDSDYLTLVRHGPVDSLHAAIALEFESFIRVEDGLRHYRSGRSNRAAQVIRITVIVGAATLGYVLGLSIRRQMRGLAISYESALCSVQDQATALKAGADEIRALNVGLERRVHERTSELEASNRELESFSYSVSHDLRAPLRSIDGMSLALLEDYDGVLDADGKRFLQRLRANTQHMGSLIDALLELSRVTRSEMRREEVNLSDVAAEIAEELRAHSPERSVRVEITLSLTAMGDRRLLRLALENLIGNAWKYTAKRGEAVIRVGARRRDQETVYFVEDNGAGFNMAYYDKLFGAFQRLHAVSEFEGTGIGLATVQRIVRRHGGRIWAEGAVDSGATFYFTLA